MREIGVLKMREGEGEDKRCEEMLSPKRNEKRGGRARRRGTRVRAGGTTIGVLDVCEGEG